MLSFAHQIHAVKDVGDAYTREYSSTHILKELSAPSHKGTHNKNEKEKKDRSKATMPKQRINCWLFNSFPNMQQQEKSEFNLVVMFAVRWSDDSLPFLLLLLLLLIIIVARCVPLSVWWLSVCVLHSQATLFTFDAIFLVLSTEFGIASPCACSSLSVWVWLFVRLQLLASSVVFSVSALPFVCISIPGECRTCWKSFEQRHRPEKSRQ